MHTASAAGSFVLGSLGDILSNNAVKNTVKGAAAGTPYAKVAQLAIDHGPKLMDAIHDRLARPDRPDPMPDMATRQALAFQSKMDADNDGVLSKSELDSAMTRLESAIDELSAKETLTPREERKLARLEKMHDFGLAMGKHFNNIAAQDDARGISQRDIVALAGQDGRRGTISLADFRALNSDDIAKGDFTGVRPTIHGRPRPPVISDAAINTVVNDVKTLFS